MEFTGNIDSSEIRELVQDQIDNIDLDSMIDDRTDSILSDKDIPDVREMERTVEHQISDYECETSARLDDIECMVEANRERISGCAIRIEDQDERIAQAVVTEADFNRLVQRLDALENLVTIGAKMLRLMQAFACTPESSDAPEA